MKNLHVGEGYAIKECRDSGYVITGESGALVLLLKTDKDGNLEFSKTYGHAIGMSPGNTGNDILVLADGGLIIAGKWMPFANETKAYFIRTDSTGTILWEKTVSSPIDSTLDVHYAQNIQVTNSNEFISTGNINLSTGEKDISLMKLRSTGSLVWIKHFNLGANEFCYDLQITDSFFLLIGRQSPPGGGMSNYFILKTDTSGNILDYKIFGNNFDSNIANSLYLLTDTSYIISGMSSFPSAQSFFWNRLDSKLDSIYLHYITNPTYNFGCGNILRNSTNSFTVSGLEEISPGNIMFALIIQVDSNGVEINRKYLTDSIYQLIDGACLNRDGSMVFTGGISGTNLTSGVYFVKIDSAGLINYSKNIFPAKMEFEIKNIENILFITNSGMYNQRYNYSLFSVTGELIKFGMIDQEFFTIDCTEFTSGIYILKIIPSNHLAYFTRKIIINH